jgi:hypothetical protein
MLDLRVENPEARMLSRLTARMVQSGWKVVVMPDGARNARILRPKPSLPDVIAIYGNQAEITGALSPVQQFTWDRTMNLLQRWTRLTVGV